MRKPFSPREYKEKKISDWRNGLVRLSLTPKQFEALEEAVRLVLDIDSVETPTRQRLEEILVKIENDKVFRTEKMLRESS